MDVQLQEQWNGHRLLTAVIAGGISVARFEDEDEARQWAANEYGIDADSIEWDR